MSTEVLPTALADLSPTLDLPNGEKVKVLSPDLISQHEVAEACVFKDFPPKLQRKTIRVLEAFLQESYAKPQKTDYEKLLRYHLIDTTSWRLAQCYRYSNPPRIEEAVAPLTSLVETHRQIHNNTQLDIQPALFLVVALSRLEGEEERAIQLFNEVIRRIPDSPEQPKKNLLWARANMARMYRNKGRVAEATAQEKLARSWILEHPLHMPPSDLKDLLADDIGTGSHILDHPEIVFYLSSIKQVGTNAALINNGTAIFQYNAHKPHGFYPDFQL